MIKWLKKQVWLPLAGLIFGTYMIQRGLASLAKAGIADHLKDATAIMFTVAGIAALLMGVLVDNVKAKTMILIGGVMAALGVAALPYTPWAFGLLFGAGVAIFKIVAYSKPLKDVDSNKDSLRIAPQASAKNFGAALFVGLIGSIAGVMGLVPISIVMSGLILTLTLVAYMWIGEDRVYRWELRSVLSLMKRPAFWFLMLYSFVMVGTYYVGVSGIYPMLVATGYAKATALTALALGFVVAGFLRWPWAYLGQIGGYRLTMITGTYGLILSTVMIKMGMLVGFPLFILFGSAHTPNYWAYAKEEFGGTLLATVMGMAYVCMYLGAGVIFGKW